MGGNSQLLDHLQACHISTLKIIRVEEENYRKRTQVTWDKKRETCENDRDISSDKFDLFVWISKKTKMV